MALLIDLRYGRIGSEGGDASRGTIGVDLPSGLERADTAPGVRSIITISGRN